MTMSQWAERADMLFVGRVVKAEIVPCCDLYADITFRLTKTWKGHADTAVAVRVGWGCAELFPFVLGREYLVLARRDGTPAELLATDPCFGVLEASAAAEQMQELDAWLQASQHRRTGD